MVEAVEPFKLHLTSKSNKYEVLEHLQLLWMGIWSILTPLSPPSLEELANILVDVSVQTIPLCEG